MSRFLAKRSYRLVTCGCAAWLLAGPASLANGQLNDEAAASIQPLVTLRRAVEDLIATFGHQYPHGPQFLKRLGEFESAWPKIRAALAVNDPQAKQQLDELEVLKREALLANPLLDFDRLLLIKRGSNSPKLGLPMNWQGNASLPHTGFDDEIAILSRLRSDGALTTLYRPPRDAFVGDVDLHFDGQRLLFSSIGTLDRWQVFEIHVDGSGWRQVTRGDEPDVDNYDACYLPGGQVMFTSTACFQGVPCVKGADHVANLYLMDADGSNVRRLTFDQDHDWCPTVLENGRVLYLRWEYADIPHFASRILFHMNPDGTEQVEFYGSNSYWPNSMFYARPVPGHPSKFTAVISGHHDVPRMGELVVFDAAKGRHEADGVVQRIPGFGMPVEPILLDGLVKDSWPKFLHPWPLNEKYFLVSAKPTPNSNWGIYLVDVFDNLLLLKELSGYALLEPIPLRARNKPPVIPSRIRADRTDATVYLEDVYAGPGLAGVPRGMVHRLRLFSYHFAYHGMGGQINRVGLDGPWDVKRVLGTVPVEEDGSALFRIPANMPISVQPLDADGKALQLMRSWFVGMPGEQVSCVGCHVRQHYAPSNRQTMALSRSPSEIAAWYGPPRGFSFEREVQPVLDKHCVRCHNGKARRDGKVLSDLTRQPPVHPDTPGSSYRTGTQFSPSYLALRRFVRVPTIESDMHLLTPMDFHADTSRLVQWLQKDHSSVRLDDEAWDRLITWIDLGAPAHGTWHEIVGDDLVSSQCDRRRAMMVRYSGPSEDPEAVDVEPSSVPPASPPAAADGEVERPTPHRNRPAPSREWSAPTTAPAEFRMASETEAEVDLGDGIKLQLVLLPSGEMLMGSSTGHHDERPTHRVQIGKPFWIGRFEVTNEQYRQFDPAHDSRLEHGDFLQFSQEERGYPLNDPRQPVARVSWYDAAAFCDWLSARTGKRFALPTEAQWEYACRAGTNSPLSFGGLNDDFSPYANLADARFKRVDSFEPWKLPVGAIPPWRPADDRFTDGYRVSAPVDSFQPNSWGLADMHGNAAEWTRSTYRRYPYKDDERNGREADGRRVVRGGSWYDRPKHATSTYRIGYWPYQRVYDVGFRVVCEP